MGGAYLMTECRVLLTVRHTTAPPGWRVRMRLLTFRLTFRLKTPKSVAVHRAPPREQLGAREHCSGAT